MQPSEVNNCLTYALGIEFRIVRMWLHGKDCCNVPGSIFAIDPKNSIRTHSIGILEIQIIQEKLNI